MNEGREAFVWARVRVCARAADCSCAHIRGHERRLIKLQRESIVLLYLNFDNVTPLKLNNYTAQRHPYVDVAVCEHRGELTSAHHTTAADTGTQRH